MLSDSFGLLDKTEDRWKRLTARIHELNGDSDDLTAYKLIYLARHGEGYHNVAEAKYGKEAWDCVSHGRLSILPIHCSYHTLLTASDGSSHYDANSIGPKRTAMASSSGSCQPVMNHVWLVLTISTGSSQMGTGS